jgi:hypothetical protein
MEGVIVVEHLLPVQHAVLAQLEQVVGGRGLMGAIAV